MRTHRHDAPLVPEQLAVGPAQDAVAAARVLERLRAGMGGVRCLPLSYRCTVQDAALWVVTAYSGKDFQFSFFAASGLVAVQISLLQQSGWSARVLRRIASSTGLV